MKKYIAVLYILILLGACTQEDILTEIPIEDDISSVVVSLDEIVELPYAEIAYFEDGDFSLRFDSLVEDSRCPPNVACIWEGRAWVNLELNEGETNTDIQLITENSLNLDSFVVVPYKDYWIELIDITPSFNGNNILNPEEYTVIFKITLAVESNPCVFEQVDENMDGVIDEIESSIMQACFENRFESVETIAANIIGSWELVGHGEGWIPTVSQPCASIEITEDGLTFSYADGYVDETTSHTWEIVETDNNYPYLKVTPQTQGLYLNIFCEEYMYGDGTPFDGNMYLYQKTL